MTINTNGPAEPTPAAGATQSAVPSIGRPRTTAETAAYFKVEPSTLWRWRKAGLLGCTKIGGTVRFTDEQIAACLARQSSDAMPPPSAPKFNPKYPHLAPPTQ